MSAATASQILLAFGTGYWACRVRDFVHWRRTRSKRFYE